jgi:L-asparagine transporter-like permease
MFFVWTTILVTHLRFRSALSLERIRALPVRMPIHGIASMFGIVVILALSATTVFVEGLEWTVPLLFAWLAIITAFYLFRSKSV